MTKLFRFTLLSKTAFASPLDTTLTSKRAAKSFSFNTYKKHTGGEGGGVEPRASTRELRVKAQGTFDLPSAPRIESARTSGFARMGRPKRSGTMRNGLFLGVAAILLWFALAAPLAAQAPEREGRSPEARAEGKAAEAKDAAPPKEESSVTEHTMRIGGHANSHQGGARAILPQEYNTN